MNQWLNDTLVAVEAMTNNKYRVVELPARATQRIISKRRFKTAEAAEQYIEQYSDVVRVAPEDIAEEIERRTQAAQHPLLTEVLHCLQDILEQLEAMQPMEPPGTSKALENHEAWMAQRQHMRDLIDDANRHALWAVPDTVSAMLEKINERWRTLTSSEKGNGNDAV